MFSAIVWRRGEVVEMFEMFEYSILLVLFIVGEGNEVRFGDDCLYGERRGDR